MKTQLTKTWFAAVVVVTVAAVGTAVAGGHKGMGGGGGGNGGNKNFSQKSFSGIGSSSMKLQTGSQIGNYQSQSSHSQQSIKSLKLSNNKTQDYKYATHQQSLGNTVKLNGLVDKTKLQKTGPHFPSNGVTSNGINKQLLGSDVSKRIAKGFFGQNPIDPGIGNGNGSGKGGPFKKQPYCFPNYGCWPNYGCYPNYGCNYPIWWGGGYGYPNYGCSYPSYPTTPVTVSGGSTTVLVSAPAEQAVPANIVAGIDLQLVDVQLLDAGNPNEQIGPRYRVTFRNAGSTTIDREFNVVAMAAMDGNLSPELPQAMVRVNGAKANELTFVDLRLPATAFQMPVEGAKPATFAKLVVFVDSHQEIDDANRENNMSALDRTSIKPVK